MSNQEPSTEPRRRSHLMDPNNLQRPSTSNTMSLTHVQQWVMSVLAVVTILHLSAGLVIAAVTISNGQLSAQIGLNLIAGAFGVMAVAAGLAIHQKNVLSPWLLLGLAPAVIGLWITFQLG